MNQYRTQFLHWPEKFIKGLYYEHQHKQFANGVLRKRSAENMQRICRRTPMPENDFNKVVHQHGYSPDICRLFSELLFIRTTQSEMLVHTE